MRHYFHLFRKSAGILAMAWMILFLAAPIQASFAGESNAITQIDQEIEAIQSSMEEVDLLIEAYRMALKSWDNQRVTAQYKLTLAGNRLGRSDVQLMEIDKQIAKLTSPYDLTVAWKEYVSTGNSREAFTKLHRIVRGVEPANSIAEDATNRAVEAKAMETEIRKKVAIPVGHALCLIGKILVDFTKLFGQTRHFVQRDAVKVFEKSGQPVLLEHKMPAWMQEFVSKPFIEKLGLINTGTATVRRKGARLLKNMEVVKQAKSYLKYMISVPSDYLMDIAQYVSIPKIYIHPDNAWEKANAMAQEMQATAHRDWYGVDNRAAAHKKAVAVRADFLKIIESQRQDLNTFQQKLNSVVNKMAPLSENITELIQWKTKKLEELSALVEKRHHLISEQNYEQFKKDLEKKEEGKQYFLDISLTSSEKTLAADSITARLLNLPRSTGFEVKRKIGIFREDPCYYGCETSGKSSRISCQYATRKNLHQTDLNDPSIVDVTLSSSNKGILSVDLDNNRIWGKTAGEAGILAETNGVVSTVSTKHAHHDKGCGPRDTTKDVTLCCDFDTQLKEGKLKSALELSVFGVLGLDVTHKDEPVGNGTKVDLFFSNKTGNFYLAGPREYDFNTHVRYGSGKGQREYRRRVDADIQWTTGKDHFEISEGYLRKVRPRSPGKGTLLAGLKDNKDTMKYSTRINFTANLVDGIDLEMPKEALGNYNNKLPIGMTATYHVNVLGGADMKAYRIFINNSGELAGIGSMVSQSGFSYKGDGLWSASFKIKFNPSLINPRVNHIYSPVTPAYFRPNVTILDPNGNVIADGLSGEGIYAAAPAINHIEVAGANGGARLSSVDLFAPSSGGAVPLELEVFYVTGEKARYTMNYVQAQVYGSSVLKQQGTNLVLGVSRYSGSKGYNISSAQVGQADVVYEMDQLTALNHNLALTKDILSDRLHVTLNKVVVQSVETQDHERYRLTIFGPADMQGRKATWHLADGSSQSTAFSGSGSQMTSEILKSQVLNRVDLISRTGRILGSYLPNRDGRIKPTPKIFLYSPSPDEMLPGTQVPVRASIHYLPAGEEENFKCVWEVDPAFGDMSPGTVAVKRKAPGTGECTTTLKIKSNPGTAEPKAQLKIRLLRLVGKEGS